MLKNVAIPLMLAASEAEAQPTKDEIREALEGDLEEKFAGLQADAAACTVASSQAADNIANLAQAVSDAKAAQEIADAAVTAAIAVDGAWGIANEARKAAVSAAVAQEVEEGIAGLLDDLDAAAEAERVAAKDYVTANNAYEAGLRRQTAAVDALGTADTRKGELLQARDDAVAAVTAAKEQATKESTWRGWRYCELGGPVVGATLSTAAQSSGFWAMYGSSAAALPASCVVPAVLAADGVAEARGAVTYYSTTDTGAGGLAAESEDGYSKWTATLVHTTATTAENAESNSLDSTYQRTKAGEVAWHTGNLRARQWTEMARTRESTWFGAVNGSRATALAAATLMADNNTHDQPNPLVAPFLNNAADATIMTAGSAGANKAMVAAATARDVATHTDPGSGYVMPGARAQNGNAGQEWKMGAWAVTTATMNSWKTANATQGASWLWWDAARAVTTAMSNWWTKWDTGGATGSAGLTAGVGMTQTEVKTSGGSSAKCDTSGAGWAADAGAGASAAACKTACETLSINALLVDPDTNTPTVDNGGKTAPVFTGATAATGWCGGYSYDGANDTCHHLTGSDSVVTGGAAGDADDRCYQMATVKAFADLQGPVAVAYAAVTATLVTNMTNQVNTQVGLEKAWLQAWYVQQYWAQLKVQLTASGGSGTEDTDYGGKSTTIKQMVDTLAGSGTVDSTTVAGATAAVATAQTALNTAQEQLATLQATTAAAAAVVAGLGTRILRADAQIAELEALANTGATGTLDAAAALRTTDYDDYNAGAWAAADAEKTAADAAVKARTGAGTTDGGALVETREETLATWTAAKQTAEDAQGALTVALGVASLVGLRETVVEDTGKWDDEQLKLIALVTTAEEAEEAVKEAEKAKDAAVLACQIKAYDAYRTALEAEMVQRAEDLKAIKALLEKELVEPTPGTAGARCEKALSNGTYRPARGETTCAEGLCCGAARVWMESGTEANSAWRTIETCQLETDTTYMYQPPRAPMATTMPDKVSVDFVCIEGAKKLAAAASAVAAAVYMLA